MFAKKCSILFMELLFGLILSLAFPLVVLATTYCNVTVNYTYYNNLGQKITKTKGTYRVQSGKAFSLGAASMPSVAGNSRVGVASFRVTKSQTKTVNYARNSYPVTINYRYYSNTGALETAKLGTYSVAYGATYTVAASHFPGKPGHTTGNFTTGHITGATTEYYSYNRQSYTLTENMVSATGAVLASPKTLSVAYGTSVMTNVPTQLSQNGVTYFLPAQEKLQITGNQSVTLTYYQPTLTNLVNNVVTDTSYSGANFLPLQAQTSLVLDAVNGLSTTTEYQLAAGALGVARNAYGINLTNLTYQVGNVTMRAQQSDFTNFVSSDPSILSLDPATGDILSVGMGSATVTATFKWNTAQTVSVPVTLQVPSNSTPADAVYLKDYLINQTTQMYWLNAAIVTEAQKELPIILAADGVSLTSPDIQKYNAIRDWLAIQPYDNLLCYAAGAQTYNQLNNFYSFENDPNVDLLQYIPLLDTLSMVDDNANDTLSAPTSSGNATVNLVTDNVLNKSYQFNINGTKPTVVTSNGITQTYINAYNGTGSGIGICQDYADSFTLLANLAGIKADTVTSSTLDHAWNGVCIGGQWYETDLTWMNSDYNPTGSKDTYGNTAQLDNVTINNNGQLVSTGGTGYQYDLNSDASILYSHGLAINNAYGSPTPDAPYAAALAAQATVNYPSP